jgi:hypothetical protein
MQSSILPNQTTSSNTLRRSDRIEISISVEVSGTDLSSGREFCQQAETLAVSRHGAAIILNYGLATHQQVTIRCLTTNEEAEAKVIGLLSSSLKDLVYGVAFVDPASNPWGIEFPTLTGSEDGLVRMLLVCRLCSTEKVVHLEEIEIEVFDAHQAIQQFCGTCGATTSWKRVEHKPTQSEEPTKPTDQKSSSEPAEVVNRRRHGRVKSNASACIRQPGCPDEIVTCENISRGGISCQTSKPYQEGGRIEVAVPYSAGSGNIFVPARIVRVQKSGKFFRLGVAYEIVSSTQQKPKGYSGERTYHT